MLHLLSKRQLHSSKKTSAEQKAMELLWQKLFSRVSAEQLQTGPSLIQIYLYACETVLPDPHHYPDKPRRTYVNYNSPEMNICANI